MPDPVLAAGERQVVKIRQINNPNARQSITGAIKEVLKKQPRRTAEFNRKIQDLDTELKL